MTTDFDRFLSFISSTDFKWNIDFMDANIPFKTPSKNLYKFLVKEGNGTVLDDRIHIKQIIVIKVNAHANRLETLHAFTENGLYIGSTEIQLS